MAATLYPGNRLRSGRRGLSIIECALALSVIVGFVFVTVRVMSLGLPASLTQTVAAQGAGTEATRSESTATNTVAAQTETPRLASETTDTKTP